MAIVKIKSTRYLKNSLILTGGSENSQFVQIEKINNNLVNNNLHIGDIVVSINKENIVGYTLRDANFLLNSFSNQSIELEVWPQHERSVCLKTFLNEIFPVESECYTIKVEALKNLCQYLPILRSGSNCCRVNGNYLDTTTDILAEMYMKNKLLHVLKHHNVLYGVMIPPTGATLFSYNQEYSQSMRDQLRSDIDSILSEQSASAVKKDLARYNAKSTITLSDIASVGYEKLLYSYRKKVYYHMKFTVKLVPNDKGFGLTLRPTRINHICDFVNSSSKSKCWLQVVAIESCSPAEKCGRIDIGDALIRVDKLNIYDNKIEEMINYVQAKSKCKKSVTFVFMRLCTSDDDNHRHSYKKKRIACKSKDSESNNSLMGYQKQKDPSIHKIKYLITKPIQICGFDFVSTDTLNTQNSTINNYTTIQYKPNNDKNNLKKMIIRPGDILYSINGERATQKSIEDIKICLTNALEKFGQCELVFVRGVVSNNSQHNKPSNICYTTNKEIIPTEKVHHKKTKQLVPYVGKKIANNTNTLHSNHNDEKKQPPSTICKFATEFIINTMLSKHSEDKYGFLLKKNNHHQYIIDDLIANGIAHTSNLIEKGDILLAVNNITLQKLPFKSVQSLINKSKNCIDLKLHKSIHHSNQSIVSTV